jgi:cytoskeleton protein RodZ
MQTIGERLEEARKRKGISIREAAEATKIRGDYLHKYESNQFDLKLPEIYVRGFLRLYANYLKLPAEKLVSDYLALGLGEGGKPQGRGLNREIYGKIEITHASASSVKNSSSESASSGGASGSPTAGAEPASHSPQRQPFQPRMPLGGLDRALLAKNGVWIGVAAAVVLCLVVWGVVKLFSGDPAQPSSNNAAAVIEDPVYLIALRPVQILSVKGRIDGRDVGTARSLVAGERYPLPNADMLINVSDRSAVQFEYRDVRYGAGSSTGPGVLTINFTAQR